MKRASAVVAVLVLLCLGSLAQAVVVDTVSIGDMGNLPDTRYVSSGNGSVGYSYRLGKYEITAGQYTSFLNAVAATDIYGLYNPNMWDNQYGCKIQRSGSSGSYSYSVAADWANRPVNFVSFWDSLRFANWLHNGQRSGPQNALTTEDGAYAVNGYNGVDGRWIQRKPGWKWALASEDEWYKAAYYKGNGTNAGYWDYPTQSDMAPSNQLVEPDPGNNATYYSDGYTVGAPYYRTEVGTHENSDSAYGTFDQAGNVWEWNEAIPYRAESYVYRGLRGGSFSTSDDYREASSSGYYGPMDEHDGLGFRVSAVPEPSSLIALAGGLVGLLGMRRRPA